VIVKNTSSNQINQ